MGSLGNTLILVAAACLLPLKFNAQNRIYTEEYNYNTQYKPTKTGDDKLCSYLSNDMVYTVLERGAIDTDVLDIQAFNTKTKKSQSIRIKKSKDNKMLFNRNIYSFAVERNKLIILTSQYIFIFITTNGLEYRLQKTIKNTGSFSSLYHLTDHEVLLYVNYHFHPADEPNPHAWAKLYVDNDSIAAPKYMSPDNLLFSYFTNNWISTYKGLIAYSNTTSYEIRFYDDKLMETDSIKSDKLNSNKEKLHLLPDGNGHSMDEMNKIGKLDDSLLVRIQKIFLLDSTHLLVTLKQAKTSYLTYDLWNKHSGKWVLSKTQSLPGYYEEGKEYTASNNYLNGFYGNTCGLVYANNYEFYYIYLPFMENAQSKSFNWQTDYYDKVNELTLKKELYYGIKKLKILAD